MELYCAFSWLGESLEIAFPFQIHAEITLGPIDGGTTLHGTHASFSEASQYRLRKTAERWLASFMIRIKKVLWGKLKILAYLH